MIPFYSRKLSIARIGLVASVLTLVIGANALADNTQLNLVTRNWAGYADKASSADDQFTSVSGTWTVPTIVPQDNTHVSTWVGLDGFNSGTVEQIGFIADNDPVNGLVYSAIYEFYPADSVKITSVSISPGDSLTASVLYNYTTDSGDYITLSLNNNTTGQSFSTSQFITGAARSSAEWIVEPPSFGGQIASMADFGSLTFTNASVALDGNGGVISDFSPTGIDIHALLGLCAATSALDVTGTSFTVTTVVPEPCGIVTMGLILVLAKRVRVGSGSAT